MSGSAQARGGTPGPYGEVDRAEWEDWHWQLANAARDARDLSKRLVLSDEEIEGLRLSQGVFRTQITPYALAIMDPRDPSCPIRRQLIPSPQEAVIVAEDSLDPIGEDRHRPVPGLVHKYPDRALFIAVDHCAVYCRHCTRRRITAGGEASFGRESWAQAFDYLKAHPQIREVIISGGDPLLLSDERLAELLEQLASIPSVEVLRMASRLPVVLPMRITAKLTAVLAAHAPLFFMTHFNHPKECTAEAMAACERLVDAGIPVENQTVLLRAINDDPETIRRLNLTLLRHRVRPYYLHQGDLAAGTAHLRTPLSKGLAIVEALRGHSSGLAVPHFAVDLPGGHGKVTLQPQAVAGRADGQLLLRSYQGHLVPYPDTLGLTRAFKIPDR